MASIALHNQTAQIPLIHVAKPNVFIGKNTQDAVVYTNTNLEFLDALEGAGVDFETGGMHIDELHFYKDGKELASLDIDGLQDATAVSKAWADIVSRLGIS